MTGAGNRRILIVDDMPAIHEDFAKILATPSSSSALDAVESTLFGDAVPEPVHAFELDSAYQGAEALSKVTRAVATGRPYALAFVDMRMPPGWNGAQTIERLWAVDERLQVVVCTAYSDLAWEDVLARLDVRDRLLILKKPFETLEVLQLASTLTAKWEMSREAAIHVSRLEQAVRERTVELTRLNRTLQAEISEREHLQDQLVQQEKLASIGQLAAGVAHEINNPIGYIFSNFGTLEQYQAQLFEMLAAYEAAETSIDAPETLAALIALKERVELSFLKEDIPTLMKESREGVVRVRRIVRALQDFSHVDANPRWEEANLVDGIESTLNVVNSEIKYKAEIVRRFAPIPPVECIASEINQVVMNLVVNAAQAMGSERGKIVIETGTDGNEVWIEVADNGSGIPDHVLPRIFDPFYTTKPVGKGTGLGLSLSYGIVRKHRGRIDVKTKPGAGTTFRVTLPVHQAAEVGPVGGQV